MLDVINKQKIERDTFLAGTYLERDGLELAKNSLSHNLIKVIIGPRRAGKSIFGFSILKNKNFAYLNFEDEDLLKIDKYDNLIPWLEKIYPSFTHIFLDEIQNLPSWEIWVNKLHRRGYNLVITGSNSKLLSGELASSLTGRYQLIEIFPLSLNEIKKMKPNYKITDYLSSGGYPEVVLKNLDGASYLKTLFEAILFKDIVKRYNLRQSKQIYDLGLYLTTNFSTQYSYGNLKKNLNLSSVATTQKYVGYLEQSYLHFSLNKFDYKIRNQVGYNKKSYIVDSGFGSSVGFQNSENLGRLLENTIFIKLVRDGFVPNKDLFYYKTKSGKEVDFLIRDGLKTSELIQVCLNLDSEKTKNREKKALLEASIELNCKNMKIITLESNGFEDKQSLASSAGGIEIIKAEDYLNTSILK